MKKIFLCILFLIPFGLGTNSVLASSEWRQLSDPLSADVSGATSIVVDSNGIVYAGFQEHFDRDAEGHSNKIRLLIKKYEAGSWSLIGVFDSQDVYDDFTLRINSVDELFVAYRSYTVSASSSEDFKVYVERYNSGVSWEYVGVIEDSGIALSSESPTGVRLEIGKNNELYLAYIDSANLKFFEYTGNILTDFDGQNNDGWESVFEEKTSVVDFDFSIDNNNDVYLVIKKNQKVEEDFPDYALYVYKYEDSWKSVRSSFFDTKDDGQFVIKGNSDGFFIYVNEETTEWTHFNAFFQYTNSTSSWEIISDDEEFLDDDYNFFKNEVSPPLFFSSNGDLYFVYGNSQTVFNDIDNRWGSATVVKYSDGNWSYLGNRRFSGEDSTAFSIAVSNDGVAYAICQDSNNNSKATVFTIKDEDFSESTPEQPNSLETNERLIAKDSGLDGLSPITGLFEDISLVGAGEFVRSYGFNTIYYIDKNLNRRPFWDTNSFFTYADSFDEVVWVTDATLPTLALGSPMLPNPGVVLVKIQSDPKVYAIDTGNVLRWIPDEATAMALYGVAWADYIIDLEPTTFVRFTKGSNMTATDIVYSDYMISRSVLTRRAK